MHLPLTLRTSEASQSKRTVSPKKNKLNKFFFGLTEKTKKIFFVKKIFAKLKKTKKMEFFFQFLSKKNRKRQKKALAKKNKKIF